MKMNKKGISGGNVFWIAFSILAVVGILVVGFFATRSMVAKWGDLGDAGIVTSTPFNIPEWNGLGKIIENGLNFLFGVDVIPTWQVFAIMAIVLLILGVAFTDILTSFSTFKDKEVTVPIIAWALALLASIMGVVRGIAVWLGITAGLGAVGIGIVIVNSVIIFVAINLFMGNQALRALHRAKDLKEVQQAADQIADTFNWSRVYNEESARAAKQLSRDAKKGRTSPTS